MPIYEYRCKKCCHEFEELLISGDKVIICPECRGKDAEKLISRLGRIDGESYEHRGGSCCHSDSCGEGCCDEC